jgi:chitinase
MSRSFVLINHTGTWDGANKFTQKVVQAHTNLTEIDRGLDLLWRNNIDSKKVVLGLGFYGRAFTLQDPSCSDPGCPFSGGAKKGKCTGESGILSNSEIQDVIAEKGVKPTLVKKDAIKYLTWDSDQWVSKPGKDRSVNNLLNAGTSVGKWNTLQSKRAITRSNALSLGLFWSACAPVGSVDVCPKGYRPIAFGHGKVFDADLSHLTGEGCHGR